MIVKFRVGWEMKNNVPESEAPLSKDIIREKLRNSLDTQGSFINEYLIKSDTVSTTGELSVILLFRRYLVTLGSRHDLMLHAYLYCLAFNIIYLL